MALSAAGRLVLTATDEQYPAIVHLPHSFRAMSLYRQWRAQEGQPKQWFLDLVVSFWSHSMGGGAAGASLLEGKSLLCYLTKKDFALFHTIVYLATYWSPRDIVYRTLLTPKHPLRLLCVGADAIDGFTTLASCIDKGFKSYPDNWLLPLVSGVLMYNTGSAVRCLDQRLRGDRRSSCLQAPGGNVARGVVQALAYCLFARVLWRGRRRDTALIWLCWLAVAVELVEDVLEVDAYAHLHKPGLALLQLLQRRCHLGSALPDGEKVA